MLIGTLSKPRDMPVNGTNTPNLCVSVALYSLKRFVTSEMGSSKIFRVYNPGATTVRLTFLTLSVVGSLIYRD